MLRQPDFAVDARHLNFEARALVQAGQEHAPPHVVHQFGFSLDPLVIGLVDPELAAKLGEKLRNAAVRMKAGPRRGFEDPGVPAIDPLFTGQPEVECVRDLFDRLALALPPFFPLRDAFRALRRGLVSALGDGFFQLLLLGALLFRGQGPVVCAGQPAVWRAIHKGDVVQPDFVCFHAAVWLEFAGFVALQKAVAALGGEVPVEQCDRVPHHFTRVLRRRGTAGCRHQQHGAHASHLIPTKDSIRPDRAWSRR